MAKLHQDITDLLVNLKAQVNTLVKISIDNDPTIDLKKEKLSEKELILKTFNDMSTAINKVAIWQEQKNEQYSKLLQQEKDEKEKILQDCNQFRLVKYRYINR